MVTEAVFDLKGLKCPLPVLRSRKKLSAMLPNEDLVVETTDPLAVIDIPHMCREDGHILLETIKTEDGHRFRIRRGEQVSRSQKDGPRKSCSGFAIPAYDKTKA